MLRQLFQQTPTVEEFRRIVLKSIDNQGLKLPNDKYVDQEYVHGFEYCMFLRSDSCHMLYLARCKDIRDKNCKIQFVRQRLS